MFSQQQLDALKAPLSSAVVKTRSQAGRELSYIEGWHAIAEANRIFGFHNWNSETVEIARLGEPREVDGKWRVAFMAKVRITVVAYVVSENGSDYRREVVREGCGYGSGIDRDLGQSHESALKEAETDARKRALMTFGNPFGLALYDKEQREVAREPSPSEKWANEFIGYINGTESVDALGVLWRGAASHVKALPDDLRSLVAKAKDDRKAQLMGGK
jgi:DNA repair and recombination protein RAD52